MSKIINSVLTLTNELLTELFAMYNDQGTVQSFIDEGLCDNTVTADQFMELYVKKTLQTFQRAESDRLANWKISKLQASIAHPEITVEVITE